MGEVREPEHAEDQRDPQRTQRVDRADGDARGQGVAFLQEGPEEEEDDRRPKTTTGGDLAGFTLEVTQTIAKIR